MPPIKINTLKLWELSQEAGDDFNGAVIIESADRDTLSDTRAFTGNPVITVSLDSLTANLVGDLDEGPLAALIIDRILHGSALLNSMELLYQKKITKTNQRIENKGNFY